MNFRYTFLVTLIGATAGQVRSQSTPTADSTPAVTKLDAYVVTGQLDQTREAIQPSLGATSFIMDQTQILSLPQGADAPFNQVLLRAPGVAEDSAANGDLHVRGEHANLQYRINDVLLPEGITGFGLELDPRFVQSMQLITGSLPAQYGFRTAGVVDIKTKTGGFDQGGTTSLYAGSFDTVRPSFEVGGTEGNLSYFTDASYDHNAIGIENPTPSATPVHDDSDQYKAFAYLSYILNRTSRITFMGSASYSNFQVPDTLGLPAGTSPDGSQWLPDAFDSSKLNENQNEQNYFGVATYQKSAGDLNYQVSAFVRDSSVHFTPDPVGDLYFNGVASDVDRRLLSAGLQGDGSYALAAGHTLRGGFTLLDESVDANSVTTVFPVDAGGDPDGPTYSVANSQLLHGLFAGAYLQDEWKLTRELTLNYGVRFDVFNASFDKEDQLSPRVNLIYRPVRSTTLHAGYSRYFTPPPVENVPGGTVAGFSGTSNASATVQDDPVRAERADYFDAGISQKVGSHFQVGLDGYYKKARNQLDDGLFGQTLILSAFNYAEGRVYGLEFTSSYSDGGFSTYINLAHSVAMGKNWNSAQFLFSPDDLAYVKDHWIFLDHDQALSASYGASYDWKEARGDSRVYVDALFGTGLRTDSTGPGGVVIPNGGTVPAYYTISVGGEQSLKASHRRIWKVRLDVLNLTDNSYELRNGAGVGVNAAQYGMRRGIFGSVSLSY
ncbi:MAG TPA: TonB-dependent receptor [Opitutaceae bacterium]|nr:TonB-dependent receptor [Opitutaceae bacterium]